MVTACLVVYIHAMTIPRAVALMKPHLSRLLRAGEVVGGPASVVKELVENSLDAGATRIAVSLHGGGVDHIVVEDDGWGMTEADLALCFLPHASSKCSTPEEIVNPPWLGFRGEALTALSAASASVIIRSRRRGHDGWQVASHGGNLTQPCPASGVPGTRVEVAGLHADAPARRAMLRGAAREASHVRRLMEHLSLANPDVAWTLQSGNRQLLNLVPSTLQERIEALNPGAQGVAISALKDGLCMEGRIYPGSARMDNRWVVAGRVVQRDAALTQALRAAGREMLGGTGTPTFCGVVTPPPGAVYHNVHAAKEEVGYPRAEDMAVLMGAMIADAARPARGMGYAHGWEGGGLVPVPLDPGSGPLGHVLGIAHGAYVIALSSQGLVLVDAHAAHERILLEELRARECRPLPLANPVVVSPSPAERHAFETGREKLEAMGWAFADMDGGAIALLSVPEPLGDIMVAQAFEAALRCMGDGMEAVQERLADMACRAAWRNGDFLDEASATRLLRIMEVTPSSAICNHGRPTCVRMPEAAMAKLFGR